MKSFYRFFCETPAILAVQIIIGVSLWCARLDLNKRPPESETAWYPAELWVIGKSDYSTLVLPPYLKNDRYQIFADVTADLCPEMLEG